MDAPANKALVHEIFADLARGDPRKYLEHLADDLTITVTGENSWSRTFQGLAAARRDLWGYVHSLTNGPGKTIPHRILADEDWVIVEARGEMTAKDGRPYNNHYCLMYRLLDGKIVEMREYLDSALCERVLGPYRGAAAA